MTSTLADIDFDRDYTVEEFLELNLPEDLQYELVGGKLVARERPGPSGEHGRIITKIAARLEIFASEGEKVLGQVYSSAACTLGSSEGDYVIPDVAFVAANKIPERFLGPVTVVPDLIVEVISPSDSTERIHNKWNSYLAAEVRMIWSIYLLDQFVIVHRLGENKRQFLEFDDELDGGDILPGFRLKVSSLFK